MYGVVFPRPKDQPANRSADWIEEWPEQLTIEEQFAAAEELPIDVPESVAAAFRIPKAIAKFVSSTENALNSKAREATDPAGSWGELLGQDSTNNEGRRVLI